MFEISQQLLSMYDESQNLPPTEFTNNSFTRLQKLLKFDSAGFLSFAFSEIGDMRIASAFSFNLNEAEKLEARNDFALPGKLMTGRGFVGADPLLIKSFNTKYKSHYIDTIPADSLVEYGKRTQSLHTMVMVVDDLKFSGYNSVALWRSKTASNYRQEEAYLSDIFTPHFFSALRINRAASETPNIVVGKQLKPVICSVKGVIHFIDKEVFKLFENEWNDWKPPFLPSIVFDEMRSKSAMFYIGKRFIAKGRIFENLLIISIVPKNIDINLSKMEVRVASMLSDGASYKEIAAQFGTSPSTVKTQVHSIYVKLKVSRKSAVGAALKNQGYSFSS